MHVIYIFPHFPSIGSDDPPPLVVENVKIQENSEKSGELRGSLRDPLQPFLGPLKQIRGRLKEGSRSTHNFVKIRENSEKTGDLRGSLRDPLQPF